MEGEIESREEELKAEMIEIAGQLAGATPGSERQFELVAEMEELKLQERLRRRARLERQKFGEARE